MALTLETLQQQVLTLVGDNPSEPSLFSLDEISEIIKKVVLAYSAVCPRRMLTYCSTHREVHRVTDPNTETLAEATDASSLYALLNDLKTLVNGHFSSATYHRAADLVNVITEDDAEDISTACDLANEEKHYLNTHMLESGVHMVDDSANRITVADCVDGETCALLANQIKARFNAHLSRETDGRWLYIKEIVDAADALELVEES